MEFVEHILFEGKPLAYIVRSEIAPKKTTFLTPSDFKQQVGFVVYPRGGEIQRHVHRPLERHLIGTSEVIVVRQGRCEIDIFNNQRQLSRDGATPRGRHITYGRWWTWISYARGYSVS